MDLLAAIIADPNVGAEFRSALASSQYTIDQIRRVAYVQALIRHDWLHEGADDHSVWMAGNTEFKRLRAEQKEVDPDFSLWNRHCHVDFLHA